jgi:hypothetical protein
MAELIAKKMSHKRAMALLARDIEAKSPWHFQSLVSKPMEAMAIKKEPPPFESGYNKGDGDEKKLRENAYLPYNKVLFIYIRAVVNA